MIKFMTNEPAILFNKTLVLADLHLGIETDFRKSGINIPTQIEKMKEKINSLLKQTKAKRLVFLGDIKHQVPGVSFQELKEVPEFFSHFSEKIETHIVLGNHDSEIPALVEGVKIHPTEGFKLDDVYICHGHAWPKKEFLKCKCLIISHTHPLMEIKDKLGYRFVERVWVKASLDKNKIGKKYDINSKTQNPRLKTQLPQLILMPAFNPLAGGVAINSKEKDVFTSPITKLVDKKTAEVFLLDGTFLGKLSETNSI